VEFRNEFTADPTYPDSVKRGAKSITNLQDYFDYAVGAHDEVLRRLDNLTPKQGERSHELGIARLHAAAPFLKQARDRAVEYMAGRPEMRADPGEVLRELQRLSQMPEYSQRDPLQPPPYTEPPRYRQVDPAPRLAFRRPDTAPRPAYWRLDIAPRPTHTPPEPAPPLRGRQRITVRATPPATSLSAGDGPQTREQNRTSARSAPAPQPPALRGRNGTRSVSVATGGSAVERPQTREGNPAISRTANQEEQGSDLTQATTRRRPGRS